MDKRIFHLFLLYCLSIYCTVVSAVVPLNPDAVPKPLQSWVNWVLHDNPEKTCPYFYNTEEKLCRWSTQLVISVEGQTARFKQSWQAFAAGDVALPGDATLWAQAVQLNGQPATVMDINGVPMIYLPAGESTITGMLQWQRMPESIPVPANTGLVSLFIEGKQVAIPELDGEGHLWLRQGTHTDEVVEENRLDIRVYRHIIDDIPLQMITQIEIDVAGQTREALLGNLLLAGQMPMSLTSPLPARLETDGRLRLQVRPGSYTVILQTRQMGDVKSLTLPVIDGLPEEEIWVFEARNALRLVDITDVTAIDPQQTTLPSEWRQFPAYHVKAGDTLQLVEKRRGDPESAPAQLSLQRQFWLDFDGRGYSVQDHIGGTMTRGWRLEMLDSAPQTDKAQQAQLGRLSVNGQDQFITRLSADANTGVEIRQGQINVVADSRLENAVDTLPAVGWVTGDKTANNPSFQEVSAILHLPPGWSVFHVEGVDKVQTTWLQQWTLLDLFVVLVLSLAVGKLWRWYWGVMMLFTLVLTWQQADAPLFVWLSILVSMALLKVLPTLNLFTKTIQLYRNLSLLTLLIIAIPFMVQEARQAIFPQLEYQWNTLGTTSPSSSYYPQTSNAIEVQQQPMAEEAAPSTENDYLQSQQQMRNVRDYPLKSKASTKKQLAQIDPNAQVQTGQGLPAWQWQQIMLTWSGPVAANQTIHLQLISPSLNFALGFARVFLLSIMLSFFLWAAWQANARRLFSTLPSTATVSSFIALLFLAGLLSSVSNTVYATEEPAPDTASKTAELVYPPQYLLEQLQTRLLAPPVCLPNCASSPRMLVEIEQNILSIRVEIHAQTAVIVPLPGTTQEWLPQQVWVDEKPAMVVQRDENGQLWLFLSAGIHQIQLQGILPNRQAVQLPLPLKPHFVSVAIQGWRVDGVHENGLADDRLQFTREAQATDESGSTRPLEMGNLPPFVQIERTLLLGLDWQVETKVTRLTPTGSAIVLEVPLLAGESVTSEAIRVNAGKALINLAPDQTDITWLSVFDKSESIQLIANSSLHYSEVWRLNASAIWHVETTGIPTIYQQSSGQWLPEWRPYPLETVTLAITRPSGVGGQVMTIDRSVLLVKPGQRATDTTLTFTLRSSRGGQHTITLPENAQLQSVTINGISQPIRQEGQQVILPIIPGTQSVELHLLENTGIFDSYQTVPLDIGISSVNHQIQLIMPEKRWILLVGGEAIGAAVLIWGLLFVFILLSIGLGRTNLTPVKTYQWILLSLVLSQIPVEMALCVIGWLFALGWRATISVDTYRPWQFALIQIGLVLLSIAAFSSLLFAIQKGLLGDPDMHIMGNGSYGHHLNWYQDQVNALLPSVWVWSLPMWIYQVLMLMWALWLAAVLLNWLRWAWMCFSHEGLWRKVWQRKTSVQKT
ncbi:hypothetical protein [Beggiatoa leptomitoformis]|uniref:Uncharacterized protein n=1 Tax=Beggiatoa leptomitoformis TaxID=288004 RepID=A0A2N9YG27_9GAMM|nr:hypothetical protein [Beggiatoa leptomitoformis]ALG68258.1 hypothetical protein AL038_11740 [Beggiatoa leptomitoformis]AUI69433.1 hypothetical protein BLE401_12535 [Beggiatoa leptomitoformis]